VSLLNVASVLLIRRAFGLATSGDAQTKRGHDCQGAKSNADPPVRSPRDQNVSAGLPRQHPQILAPNFTPRQIGDDRLPFVAGFVPQQEDKVTALDVGEVHDAWQRKAPEIAGPALNHFARHPEVVGR
jgi:hypothetical protein